MSNEWSPDTLIAQAMGEIEPVYKRRRPANSSGDDLYPRSQIIPTRTGVAYSRDDNPTTRAPERSAGRTRAGRRRRCCIRLRYGIRRCCI